MTLTQDHHATIVERARREPAFATSLLDEAATLFLNGETRAARLLLRDLVDATTGFDGLAAETDTPASSLRKMLSGQGNPGMDDLAAILGSVRQRLGVELQAHAVAAA